MVSRICINCNNEFKTYLSTIKIGKGKYCSRECAAKLKKDKPREQWVRNKISNSLKGRMPKNFKEMQEKVWKANKGELLWNGKRGKMDWLIGVNNSNWKGDKVGYIALHAWVKRYLGTPDTCEHCGKFGLNGRQIHWANKKPYLYKRDLEDWLRLCANCHMKYDETAFEKGKPPILHKEGCSCFRCAKYDMPAV